MKKKVFILAFVFTLVAVTAVIVSIVGRKAPGNKNPLAGLEEKDLGSVRVSNQSGTFGLVNSENGWRVSEPFSDVADGEAVSRLVDALTTFAVESVISENPDKYGQFGLAPDEAVRVQVVKSGDTEAALDGWFGKQAFTWDSVYFRFESAEPVRIATTFPRFVVQRSAADYRAKALTPLARESISRLSVTLDGGQVAFTQSSETWKVTGSTLSVSKDEIDMTISYLWSIRASQFVEVSTAAATGFDDPFVSYSVSDGARTFDVTIGALQPGSQPPLRYAQTAGRDAVLLVPSKNVEDFVASLPVRPT